MDIKPGMCSSSAKFSVTYALLIRIPLYWICVGAYVGTVTSPQQVFSTIMKVDRG